MQFLSRNFVATQIAREIAQCNISHNHQVSQHFCCSKRCTKQNQVLLFATIAVTLQRIFEALHSVTPSCNLFRNVLCDQPIIIRLLNHSNPLRSPLRDKLQETLHSVTPLIVQLQCKRFSRCETSCTKNCIVFPSCMQ